MKKYQKGIFFGFIAGIIDMIPMILQDLTWDANLSALAFWIVAGFIISVTEIGLKGAKKGVLISLILLVPLAILIGYQEPMSLMPIIIMNILLGSLLGHFIDKNNKS